MKIKIIIFSIFSFLFQLNMMAQSIASHLWQDRVILLFAPDFQNKNLQKQLINFEKDQAGLDDRKLVIYQITPDAIKKNGVNFLPKKSTPNIFKKYKANETEFTFVLIGLDGGTKMKKSKVVTLEKLFGKIDQMPMRQSEIKQ